MVLNFDTLMNHPADTLERLASFLGVAPEPWKGIKEMPHNNEKSSQWKVDIRDLDPKLCRRMAEYFFNSTDGLYRMMNYGKGFPPQQPRFGKFEARVQSSLPNPTCRQGAGQHQVDHCCAGVALRVGLRIKLVTSCTSLQESVYGQRRLELVQMMAAMEDDSTHTSGSHEDSKSGATVALERVEALSHRVHGGDGSTTRTQATSDDKRGEMPSNREFSPFLLREEAPQMKTGEQQAMTNGVRCKPLFQQTIFQSHTPPGLMVGTDEARAERLVDELRAIPVGKLRGVVFLLEDLVKKIRDDDGSWVTKKACVKGGPGGGLGQTDKLQLLPRALLGRVWPAERVVMGLRVCHWMHTKLAAHVEKVLLVGRDIPVRPCSVIQTLSWFQSSKVLLEWNGFSLCLPTNMDALAFGIGAVIAGGEETGLAGGAIGEEGARKLAAVLGECKVLARLILSGHQIRAAGTRSLAGVLGECEALAHL
eukprot:CAMPEP_0181347140 /NCGR_PEP_ID=MMETSP1101-20121128/33721_1 /TAXON_ID=46948 /ORGANISM="Rhodomonas abbreviata, Strain Caron Lab Isolate" /LENGTH=477 /DNA_ID=CAMNT_0023459337 /DNA_START=80 /DNA_END=1510 /DNA_ORIENTATION=+